MDRPSASRRRVGAKRWLATDRGVSSLELAFIAPSLLALIFLVIQVSLYLYGRSVAEQAAREGVSRLRLDQTTQDYQGNHLSVESDVVAFAGNIGSGALHVDTVTSTYDDRAGTVTVTIKGTAVSITGLEIPIEESATGEIERFRDAP